MTYSKLMRVMLLTVAVLGLMSVATACEICGYKYEQVGDKQLPVEGWTIYLQKMIDGKFVPVATTTTNGSGQYCFSEANGKLLPDSKTKSVFGTYRVYEEVRDGWTQLSPAAGYHEVTLSKEQKVIQNLNFVNKQDKVVCYKGETAWAAGTRYVEKGNWATYTPYQSGNTVKIYAGQNIEAGTVTFSAPINGKVTITINLKNGAVFSDAQENLKIQGYTAVPPAKNPSPGKFTTYKGTFSGSSATITVPQYAYYGIHLDVKVPSN